MSAPPIPDTFAEFIKQHEQLPVTYGVVGSVVDVLMEALKFANTKIAGLETRCAALEARQMGSDALDARVKALEDRPGGVEYKGTWAADRLYGKNQAVTCAGSLWIALSPSVSRRPGVSEGVWQLCCKKGADGKDGK
jgi:hypothetical protein